MRATRAVVVMAKAPRPGAVMTRLAPLLGDDGCAALAEVLLRHAITTALACEPGRTFVAVDPPGAIGEVAASLPGKVQFVGQSGRDLGERMADAVAYVLAAGHRPVVVIGTDVPLLRPAHLEEAFTQMASGCDVVFGPALDGGYTLVGLVGDGHRVFGIDPTSWGGPGVLAESLEAAADAGLSVGLLEPLRDLDNPADAEALLRRADLPAAVRTALIAAYPMPVAPAP